MSGATAMDNASASRHLVPDPGPLLRAGPNGLRGLLRPRPQPLSGYSGHGPHFPQKRGREWWSCVSRSVSDHRLVWYVAVMTSINLLVTLLQLFAGVHS